MRVKPFAEDVFKKKFFAGSHPAWDKSKELENLTELYTLRVKVIISLEEEYTDSISKIWPNFGEGYRHITKSENVNFFIPDFEAPSLIQLETIVNFILKEIDNEQNLFIHCRGGLGRTGTILAATLIQKKDMTSSDAIQYVRQNYSEYAIETFEQEAILEAYEKKLSQNEETLSFNPKPW
ncbi:protein-tyrosine phosphatase family protein [Legionella yabuuchiae]|uniref:protein-tyrosine phosphatase family protein n=1 Tax=Legionella yabuuchiae TaxID=376727 RepID=UPI0010541C91|nr:dual specificity protein phosphatase family protein [Legionella yabuuchiae]